MTVVRHITDNGEDRVYWGCQWTVDKYHAGGDDVRAGMYQTSTAGARHGQPVVPYETVIVDGNLLTYGGASVLWAMLKGTASTADHYDNGNAAIAVGDDNTAAAASQTDLQATSDSTNRSVVGMEATYPIHTTGNSSTANADIQFRAVFTTTLGNFAWAEWGITNSTSSTAPTSLLLNRKVESLGTKTTAATWTATVKLSLS